MTAIRLIGLSILLSVLVLLAGCGGNGGSMLFFNVSERASWSVDDLLAFTSFGGNGQKYVYRSNKHGGGIFILTRSDADDDLDDEGGWHPNHSPDGSQIAFVGQRGAGSPSIYLMDSRDGDRLPIQQVTDPAIAGADAQPNWKPDGSKIIFATTKSVGGGGTGGFDIATTNPDGSGFAYIMTTTEIENWPTYSPDGTKIAFDRGPNDGPSDIIVRALGDGSETNITDALRTGPADLTRYEAPQWRTLDGQDWIYLHSNRNQQFDIYRIQPSGQNLERLTSDPRSEGFPVVNPDGDRLLFVRDRELWSTDLDGSNERRITRRY